MTRFNATLLTELDRHRWRHRVEPLGVLIPPPQRVKRRRARRRSPLPVFMQPPGGRPRRFTRLLIERIDPDVVLLNNLAAFNGARFARVRAEVAPDLPTLAVVHEWRAIRSKRDAGDAERARRYLESAQRGLQAVDAVVFPSRHTLRLGREELGLRYPEHAHVIPNPLQPAFASRMVDPDPSERRGVAFVGSFNERKNPIALLRALAAMEGVPAVMQGRGPLAGELRAEADRLGIGARVEFASYVEPPGHIASVIEAMRGAELLCLPSRSESFGLVIIESLATGTPVAGFGPTLREIRDRVGIDVGEPIDDPTPENVAAAIEVVRSRTWDHGRLRRAALAEFSARSVATRYAELLRSIGRRRAD